MKSELKRWIPKHKNGEGTQSQSNRTEYMDLGYRKLEGSSCIKHGRLMATASIEKRWEN